MEYALLLGIVTSLTVAFGFGVRALAHAGATRRPTASTELRVSLMVAVDAARRMSHAQVEPDHMLWALVSVTSAASDEALATLREALLARLDKLARAVDGRDPIASAAFQALIARAADRAVRDFRVTIALDDLRAALHDEASLGDLLRASGIDLRALGTARALVVAAEPTLAVADPYRGAGAPRMASVILCNDDGTTMELVVDILERFFGCSPTAATHVMLMVHLCGSAIVSELPVAEAEALVSRAQAYARERGSRLRVTARDGTEDGAGRGWLAKLQRFVGAGRGR